MESISNLQRQVIGLVARGLDNSAIARSLHWSENEVESCLSALLGTLGLSTRIELIFWANSNGRRRIPDGGEKDVA